jgi:hypothetical protein
VADLYDCLGQRALNSGEFQQRATETLDISRASFYRLLAIGRREFRFRQRLPDSKWVSVAISQNGAEASDGLSDLVGEMADAALQ